MMKAIALVSGGLDSTLAAKLIKAQGIEVIGLRFKIPFCSKASRNLPDLAIEIKESDINDDFLEMLKNPRYGYGSNMNPCIDCKILMLSKAKEMMEQCGGRFIITGEVLGQRPMSQHKQVLLTIAKRAGLEGLVLRPLSAQLLPETIPEKEGWVKRKKLFDFNGRSRKPQTDLAARLGVTDYPQPAGGCLLTDPQFSRRLRDLIEYGRYDSSNVKLLKIGRHFRISKGAKLIVGRNAQENEEIEKFAQGTDLLFLPPADIAGPSALGRGKFSEEEIKFCAGITARYCDLEGRQAIDITCRIFPNKEEHILVVSPIADVESMKYRL